MTMTKFSRINKQREEITMRVLEDMEKGGNEWKKPWVEASPLPPHNPVSGTQYSGRNFLYTYVYGMMRGYADPRWATEKQIKEMGWKIPENLQNGRGGINDELGVGIEHWGMYAYIPRVKKDGTPLTDKGGTQKFTRVRAVKENGGIYDPVHGIYIDSKVNGLGDVPHFTLYDVSVADIEECMAWGIKHLDEVPGQIHVVNGPPPTSRQSTLRVQMTVESMTLSSHFAKTVAGAMSRNSMRKRSPVSMKSLQRRTASKRVS